jgi:predicted DNA-binding transcriptional regulator YafY
MKHPSDPPSLPVSNQKRERLSWLVDLLRENTCPGRVQLAKTMEVTPRTIQRDINFLKDRLGAPIKYDRNRKGYILTEPTWFLPQVSLTEGELFSLLVARQAMAQYRGTPVENTLQRVFDKVADGLKDLISVHPDYSNGGVLSFAPSPVLPVNEEVWNTVLTAAREHRSIRIHYRSLRSRQSGTRNVDPYHILNMQGDWYLFAFDHGHQKICQFQLHRIRSATLSKKIFIRDKTFSPDTIIAQSFSNFASDEDQVTLRLHIRNSMADLLADRIFHPKQKVTPRSDGFEISFPVSAAGNRPYFHVLQWILSMGSDVSILEPEALKQTVKEEVAKMTQVLREK